ncbi:MAG: hypothetical protein QM739_01840 [Propionivibrio sp.]
MLLKPPPAVLPYSMSFAPAQRTPSAYVSRSCLDRRKTDGFPPPGCVERRFQAERRGIRLTEFDFDERITIGAPKR